MDRITIQELLEMLDGAGIIITDYDLIDETLKKNNLEIDTEIFWD